MAIGLPCVLRASDRRVLIDRWERRAQHRLDETVEPQARPTSGFTDGVARLGLKQVEAGLLLRNDDGAQQPHLDSLAGQLFRGDGDLVLPGGAVCRLRT